MRHRDGYSFGESGYVKFLRRDNKVYFMFSFLTVQAKINFHFTVSLTIILIKENKSKSRD